MTTYPSRLPSDLQRHLNAELAPGEKLLYAARPDWRAEWVKYLAMALFGVGWMSICGPMALLIWAEAFGIPVTAAGNGMGRAMALFFSLFVIPFVLAGFAILAAPLASIRANRHRVHAVTDQRILTLTAGKKPMIESYRLQTINFIKRRDGKDGLGSLSIAYGVEKDSDGDPRPLTQDWPGIPNVKAAERLIREHAKWAR